MPLSLMAALHSKNSPACNIAELVEKRMPEFHGLSAGFSLHVIEFITELFISIGGD
jgi:hypothetical protein